ncbi:unnamed protein product [Amoebophrya sp. A25]|nr:unnamed protein product [Amoebophrya sp. A25]|eukprot:GSA25T00023197001.1
MTALNFGSRDHVVSKLSSVWIWKADTLSSGGGGVCAFVDGVDGSPPPHASSCSRSVGDMFIFLICTDDYQVEGLVVLPRAT